MLCALFHKYLSNKSKLDMACAKIKFMSLNLNSIFLYLIYIKTSRIMRKTRKSEKAKKLVKKGRKELHLSLQTAVERRKNM